MTEKSRLHDSEGLAPTTEAILKDFGRRSHAFRAASQRLLRQWREVQEKPRFSTVYANWARALFAVYGTAAADERLFIRHTYLATLARLMAWRHLAGEQPAPGDEQIVSVLAGRFFKHQGIENLLEGNLLSWVVQGEGRTVGVETARQLISLLQSHDLRQLSEDVLKSLYQELVDPETRHDLGEYYTPDWLAHRMLHRLLQDNPRGTLLDPSCGSGTFLYLAVREKRRRLGDTRETLAHILDSVIGADIHPLAVTVAKTNYILALGDLLKKRRGKVGIPVYLADTIRLPNRQIDPPIPWKRTFDYIVGNPPWIALRYTDPGYQAFLKQQIVGQYRLLGPRAEQVPNLEVATLFLVRAADLYLKPGGTVAFVLPRSLFSADQHDGLRRRSFQFSEDTTHSLFWREAWDCEDVRPLFKVPTCVLIADKGPAGEMEYPITGQILSGQLERKNASLAEANRALSVQDVEFSLHTRGRRSFWATGSGTGMQAASEYRERFSRGVNAITPRPLWFVQVRPSPPGFSPQVPPLESATRAAKHAKGAWRGLVLTGNVEDRFLYATLLSTELLPFGLLGYRLVVLPIEPRGTGYVLITAEKAHKRGFSHLAGWLQQAEGEWAKRRRAKAERMSLYEYLDLYGGLTGQNPQARMWVIYNTSGTHLAAAVVENEAIAFEVSGQSVVARGFVADTKTYHCELDDRLEAFFLTAVLNAPVVDELIKPMQSRGLWGPRDIHKKPLELPIPHFDPSQEAHRKLAELAAACTQKVAGWLAADGPGKVQSVGRLRSMVREMLTAELEEIDHRVRLLLQAEK